jgi:hypothetical protein
MLVMGFFPLPIIGSPQTEPEAPVSPRRRGFFRGGEPLSCLSILASAVNMRWTACEWRKRRLPQKRGRYGRTLLEHG